jgi:transcriptional regulator GlxA family with amidase domain
MNSELPLDSRVADPRVDEVSRALRQKPWLGVAQVAGLVGLSQSRLREVFKKHTGVCITQYSLGIRLEHARILLTNTFLSIKEIRNEAGIPDASNFVRYFKQRYGEAPSYYRKAIRRRLDQQTGVHTNETPLQPSSVLAFTSRALGEPR